MDADGRPEPGAVVAGLVRRAAEILGEELGAARRATPAPGDATPQAEAGPGRPRGLADELLEGAAHLVDRVVGFVEGLAPGPPGDAAPDAGEAVPLVAAPGPVGPGGSVAVVVPVPAGASGPVLVTPALGPGRGRIPATAVACEPARLEQAGSHGVTVTVRVPPRTPSGEYRLLARGAGGFEAVVVVTVA
jgi:hypothetical protein